MTDKKKMLRNTHRVDSYLTVGICVNIPLIVVQRQRTEYIGNTVEIRMNSAICLDERF